MNIAYKTLANAYKTALLAHTWTGATPTVIKGARRSGEAAGPVVLIDMGNQAPETGVVDQTYGEHQIIVLLTVGIPWFDTDENIDAVWDMMNDAEEVIGANRTISGVTSVFIQSVRPMLFTFLSGQGQQYRGCEYVLNVLDYRNPTGVS